MHKYGLDQSVHSRSLIRKAFAIQRDILLYTAIQQASIKNCLGYVDVEADLGLHCTQMPHVCGGGKNVFIFYCNSIQ